MYAREVRKKNVCQRGGEEKCMPERWGRKMYAREVGRKMYAREVGKKNISERWSKKKKKLSFRNKFLRFVYIH